MLREVLDDLLGGDVSHFRVLLRRMNRLKTGSAAVFACRGMNHERAQPSEVPPISRCFASRR